MIKTAEQRTMIQQYAISSLAVDGTFGTVTRPGRGAAPPSPLIAVPNVTAHPPTASALTSYYSMWHCNCLCPLKG